MSIDPIFNWWQQISHLFQTRKAKSTVNVDEAKATFWGLGDNYWMQMIDGKYHQFGPEVFDKALHGKVAEPGFLASLKAGFQYASDSIGEPLTTDFYKNLHKTLCAHFKGEETNTEMSSENTGV